MRAQQPVAGDGVGDGLDKLLLAVGAPTSMAAMFLDGRFDVANIDLLNNPHRLQQRVELAAAIRALTEAIVEAGGQFFRKIRVAKMTGMSRLGPGFTIRWRSRGFHQIRRRGGCARCWNFSWQPLIVPLNLRSWRTADRSWFGDQGWLVAIRSNDYRWGDSSLP